MIVQRELTQESNGPAKFVPSKRAHNSRIGAVIEYRAAADDHADQQYGNHLWNLDHATSRLLSARRWHQESFGLSWLKERLRIDEGTAAVLAEEFVSKNYVERAQNGEYRLTDRGYQLLRASAAGKVTRKTAHDALLGLLDRVEQYNSDPHKILTVKAVAVFGILLGQSQKIGDLDVAVKYEDRNLSDLDRAETALAYAGKSGRQFGIFLDKLAWAETELRRILRAGTRTIRLQDWNSFVRIVAENPVRASYKVVFGSPEEVDAEIIKVRASEQTR